MIFQWNDENTAEAKRLFTSGLSASKVAIEIGCPSRNAVIGKMSRIGVTRGGEGKGWRHGAGRPQKLTRAYGILPIAQPEAPPQPPAVDLGPDVATNPVTLLELTDQHCRWPFGDPTSPDFHYCGGPHIADSPYCNRHHLMAYNPPPRKTTLSQEERARRQRMERSGSARAFA